MTRHGVLVLFEEPLDPVDERLAVHVHGKHAERAGGLVLVGDPLDDRHLLAAGLAENRPEDQEVGPLGALVAEDEGLPIQILDGEIGGRQPDLEGFDALDHRYGSEALLLRACRRRRRKNRAEHPAEHRGGESETLAHRSSLGVV